MLFIFATVSHFRAQQKQTKCIRKGTSVDSPLSSSSSVVRVLDLEP